MIDQYQVSTDQRSGITSDPNRPDDEQYIVRLVGQVVRVSVQTVRIVNALPADYGGTAGTALEAGDSAAGMKGELNAGTAGAGVK